MQALGRAALITAGAAAGTMAVDRALKVAVERGLADGERANVLGIGLQRRSNHRGISGSEQGGHTNTALLAAGGALALGIAGAGAFFSRGGGLGGTALQVGSGLVAGGMAANLLDRATSGAVIDFLPSPLGVLNGADLALAAGIALGGVGTIAVALR